MTGEKPPRDICRNSKMCGPGMCCVATNQPRGRRRLLQQFKNTGTCQPLGALDEGKAHARISFSGLKLPDF